MAWKVVSVVDPRARALYDRHYSRQSPGSRGILAPGKRILLWDEDWLGGATWGVVYNVFRETWRWRNTVFRNESDTLSSDAIRMAVIATQLEWRARYGRLPREPLTTEIDGAATAGGRSRWHEPGWCYLKAGWEVLRDVPAGHGRSAKRVLWCPGAHDGPDPVAQDDPLDDGLAELVNVAANAARLATRR